MSACSSRQIVKTDVKYIDRPVFFPMPDELLTECKKIEIPELLGQDEVISLFIEALVYLHDCNDKIIKIKELNE
jgi:hypothetical protein